jgi:hypothetical protein
VTPQERDRITADVRVVATLRQGDRVVREPLREPLVLGGPVPAEAGDSRHAALGRDAAGDGADRLARPESSAPRAPAVDVPARRGAPVPLAAATQTSAGPVATAPPPLSVAAVPLGTPVPSAVAPIALPRGEARPAELACADCAVVESVRAVEGDDTPQRAGAFASTVTGSVLGERFGEAHGRRITRIWNVLSGRRSDADGTTRWDVVLRAADGSTVVRRYEARPPFVVGETGAPRPWRRAREAARRRLALSARPTRLIQPPHPGVPSMATVAVSPSALPTPATRNADGLLARLAAPTAIEAMVLLAAVVLLWPSFDAVAAFGDGRDARFAADAAGSTASSAVAAAKDAATRALFGSAGVQWTGAMALAYGLLLASRTGASRRSPARPSRSAPGRRPAGGQTCRRPSRRGPRSSRRAARRLRSPSALPAARPGRHRSSSSRVRSPSPQRPGAAAAVRGAGARRSDRGAAAADPEHAPRRRRPRPLDRASARCCCSTSRRTRTSPTATWRSTTSRTSGSA